jgi:hypothetical protein
MNRTLSITLTSLLLVAPVRATEPPDDQTTKEVGRTTEKELSLVLSSSFGHVVIERGLAEKMLVLEGDPMAKGGSPFTLDYEIRNRIGYADLSLGPADEDSKKGSFKLKDLDGGRWDLKLSNAVPISFDLKLGVGGGDFNFSGLQVKDLTLSTGASDVSVAFDEPNTTTIENINIESGLSKFEGRNLGNAHFKHFRFQGAVGTYRLDFNGTLSTEVDVDIEIGMGVMTIIVPPQVGVKVYHDPSWVSQLNCDRDFRSTSDTEFTSDNYGSVPAKMNIQINSGVGSVKIRRK